MDDTEIQTEQAPPLEQSPAPSTKTRTVPLWAALAAMVAGVLTAFGVGYAINAEDAGAASERDDLSEEVDRISDARDDAEASVAVAEGVVEECRDAVEEATLVAEEADDFTGDWQTLQDLFVQFATTPVGSPEEAEVDRKTTALLMKMDRKIGALAASADRVAADATCRAT
jgi:hypothetical protein